MQDQRGEGEGFQVEMVSLSLCGHHGHLTFLCMEWC